LLDLPILTDYFFAEPTPDWTIADDNKQLKKIDRHELIALLEATKQALSASDFDSSAIQETLNGLLDTTGQKPGILFSLIRLAVSWAPFSPALNDTLATLGKETTMRRLDAAINAAQ
jgi:glutamyl-tRNA synthetase